MRSELNWSGGKRLYGPSSGGAALGESPGFGADNLIWSQPGLRSDELCSTYLAFAVCPEVRNHADNIVQTGIGTLVYQEGNERAEGVDNEASFDGAMQSRTGEHSERPLPCETDDTHDDVDDLKDRYGLNAAIEILGQEVPEDLGPEEGFDCRADLVWIYVSPEASVSNRRYRLTSSSRQHDEARPVVLD